jgi:hypothetical protein
MQFPLGGHKWQPGPPGLVGSLGPVGPVGPRASSVAVRWARSCRCPCTDCRVAAAQIGGPQGRARRLRAWRPAGCLRLCVATWRLSRRVAWWRLWCDLFDPDWLAGLHGTLTGPETPLAPVGPVPLGPLANAGTEATRAPAASAPMSHARMTQSGYGDAGGFARPTGHGERTVIVAGELAPGAYG